METNVSHFIRKQNWQFRFDSLSATNSSERSNTFIFVTMSTNSTNCVTYQPPESPCACCMYGGMDSSVEINWTNQCSFKTSNGKKMKIRFQCDCRVKVENERVNCQFTLKAIIQRWHEHAFTLYKSQNTENSFSFPFFSSAFDRSHTLFVWHFTCCCAVCMSFSSISARSWHFTSFLWFQLQFS